MFNERGWRGTTGIREVVVEIFGAEGSNVMESREVNWVWMSSTAGYDDEV